MRITPLLVMSILAIIYGALAYFMLQSFILIFHIPFILVGLVGLVIYCILRYLLKLKIRIQFIIEVILLILFHVLGFIYR